MRFRKFVSAAVAIALLGALGLAGGLAFHLSRTPITQLIVQMNPQESLPLLSWTSSVALYAFHPTDEEVRTLNEEAGARYAATFPDPDEAERLLAHFLAHGVDINSVDDSTGLNLTALHAAALNPDPRPVELLLDHGANPNALDREDRSPLDLARASQSKRPDQDYGAVIRVLEGVTINPPALGPAGNHELSHQ